MMTRIHPDNIRPLELWDLRVGPGILWDHMASADFGGVLRGCLAEVWQGTAETRSEGRVPAWAKGFASVYLTGGGAGQVAGDLMNGPWQEVLAGDDQSFAGEAGGRALLAGHDCTGWVLDLGQSTLKISTGGQRYSWPRDLDLLPIRTDEISVSETLLQRARLRQFLAAALSECLRAGAAPPEALVCALPSRLDENGVPEGSSYIGMKDDATLLPESLALAGLAQTRILVLNDAELAAVSASLDPRLQHHPALVLTIGFGVGAALITYP